MSSVLTLIGMLFIAFGCDWLAVTRIAAYYTDFDYRYWPLSRGRQLGLAALLLAVAYTWLLTGANRPVLLLAPCVLLLAFWGATAMHDVTRQRRSGNQEPPRYSD